jgi:hypothetical protein
MADRSFHGPGGVTFRKAGVSRGIAKMSLIAMQPQGFNAQCSIRTIALSAVYFADTSAC